MELVTVYKNILLSKLQYRVRIQFVSREAFLQTPLPGNRVALLTTFRERNNRSSMEFLSRPIDNID